MEYAYDATEFGETDATTGQWKIKTSPSVTLWYKWFFNFKRRKHNYRPAHLILITFTLGGGTLTNTEDCPSNVFATLNPLEV